MASVNSSHVTNVLLFLFVLIFILISFLTLIFVNSIQSKPYMDEIFHIPQAHKYCNGKFNEWDPKLTTPPGLYIVTVGFLVPISKVLNFQLCEILHLRLVNMIFHVGNLYLIYSISRKLHQNASSSKIIFTSLNLSFFPVLYFFSFLYYTDVSSTFFVLLAYLHHLYGQNMMSAAFGALSLFFRQTNIVWIFFMAGEKVVDVILSHVRIEKKKVLLSKGSWHYLLQVIQTLIIMPHSQRKVSLIMLLEIIKTCGGYLGVAALFITFVIFNEGIAVGDREAHQVCLHIPQFFYFSGFILAFGNSYLLTISKLNKFWAWCLERPIFIVASMLAMAVCLRYLTFVHPYLVADNRHYTFYIWRYFLGRGGVRYLFIPFYIYSAWGLMNIFQSKNALWKLLLVLCIILTIVPQKLLELRYFILPYLIIRLHTPLGTNIQIFAELVTYFIVNSLTLYMFTQHPYKWEGHHEVQRFMW